MKKYFIYIIFTIAAISFAIAAISLLSACSTVRQTGGKERPEEIRPAAAAGKIVHPTEREAGSLRVFSDALDLIQSSKDRKAVLPQVENLYKKIINDYYDTPLAQESYWRLISIYIDDYSPPAYEEAESLYQDFLNKYPGSPLRGFIAETLGKSYYKSAQWDKLLKVCTPAFKEYTEEGKRPKPSLMFMYAEANFNMGSVAEAERGYEIFLEVFPRAGNSIKAKTRLEEIRRP